MGGLRIGNSGSVLNTLIMRVFLRPKCLRTTVRLMVDPWFPRVSVVNFIGGLIARAAVLNINALNVVSFTLHCGVILVLNSAPLNQPQLLPNHVVPNPVLETRLPSAISQNESNIDSVRLKQKDLEFVIWQQQEEICKLNEKNQLFKFKLELIEKQLSELIKNKQENNADDRKLPDHAFNIPIIPSVTSPSDSEQFVNPNANLNTINMSLTDNVIPSVNNIAPLVDGLSERPNQHNADETPARAPFHNNNNVTSEAVPHV